MTEVQIVQFDNDGAPTVLAGNPECHADPCSKHGTCHCMCVCGFDRDDCDDCTDTDTPPQPGSGWVDVGYLDE